jgi:hypothetical protein
MEVDIVKPVIADSDCQEELALELDDVLALNLPEIESREVKYPDGSTGVAVAYDNVIVEVTLSDGSVVKASVAPVVLKRVDDRVGADVTERILGFDWDRDTRETAEHGYSNHA